MGWEYGSVRLRWWEVDGTSTPLAAGLRVVVLEGFDGVVLGLEGADGEDGGGG